MNYEQFAIWLHGFLEISNVEEINKEQTQIIKDHLALLFEKKTPDRREKKENETVDRLKKLAEEWEKRQPKDKEYPKYPPCVPVPIPTYPGFDPHKIVCSDGTGAPPTELGNSISNSCQESAVGEHFVGANFITEKPVC